jgi:hypothetical protein
MPDNLISDYYRTEAHKNAKQPTNTTTKNRHHQQEPIIMVAQSSSSKSVRFGGVIFISDDEMNASEPVWWTKEELRESRKAELEHLNKGHEGYDWRGLEWYEGSKSYELHKREVRKVETSILQRSQQLRKMAIALETSPSSVDVSLQRFACRHTRNHQLRAMKRAESDEEQAMEIYNSSIEALIESAMSLTSTNSGSCTSSRSQVKAIIRSLISC